MTKYTTMSSDQLLVVICGLFILVYYEFSILKFCSDYVINLIFK